MAMKTKDNRNKPHHSEHLSIWFSQSVQHRTKCIMNTELRHLHFQRYNPAVFTNAATKLNIQALNSTQFFFGERKKQKTYMQALLIGPVHWKNKGLHAVHCRTKLLHGLHGLHGHLELVHVQGWHWHGHAHGNWHVHLQRTHMLLLLLLLLLLGLLVHLLVLLLLLHLGLHLHMQLQLLLAAAAAAAGSAAAATAAAPAETPAQGGSETPGETPETPAETRALLTPV